MRAIDAEELKRSIAVSALIEDQKTLEQIIDEQPTIEERKTGTWEERIVEDGDLFSRRRWYCSSCGEWQTYGKTRCCPACGASMTNTSYGMDMGSK